MLLKTALLFLLAMHIAKPALATTAPSPVSEELLVRTVKCNVLNTTQAECQIEINGTVKDEVLYLPQVQDLDRLYYGAGMLAQTGYLFQQRMYMRFMPRLYSLQSIAGAKNPLLTLKIESVWGEPIQLPDPKTVRIVPLQKEWPLLIKGLALPLGFLLLFFFICSQSRVLWQKDSLKDGWLWQNTEKRVLFISLTLLIAIATQVPKMLVPSVLSVESFLGLNRYLWICVLWSLSQMLCNAVFSDPAALERIRSRSTSTDLYLSRFVGALFLVAIIMNAFQAPHTLQVQLPGLFVVIVARIAQSRLSRILRRTLLPCIYLYSGLLSFGVVMLMQELIPLPVNAFAAVTLLTLLNRQRTLLALKLEIQEFVNGLREALCATGKGQVRTQALVHAIQEYWDGARVSLVSLRGEMGLLMASAGPLALAVHSSLAAKKIGPMVKRVVKEQHVLYAPVAEELGAELAKQGLHYSTVAVPIKTHTTVDAVVLFMGHENERLSPQDALCLQVVGEKLSLEIAMCIEQSISDHAKNLLQNKLAQKNVLALERQDPWGRPEESNRQARTAIVATWNAPSYSRGLYQVSQTFRQELLRSWQQLVKPHELLLQDSGSHILLVAPQEAAIPATFLAQLERSFLQLSLLEHYRILNLVRPQIQLWHGPLEGFAFQEFLRRGFTLESAASIPVDCKHAA